MESSRVALTEHSQHGVLDFPQIFTTASNDIEDLITSCQQLAQRAEPA